MRKFFAAILLLAFLGQTFNQGWYYMSYLIEKNEYMARCVNKARPMMHCDGKCLLMKKIEEQEKKEQGQPPEMKYAAKIDVLSSKSSFLLSFHGLITESKRRFLLANSGMVIDQPSSIFHPPPAVS